MDLKASDRIIVALDTDNPKRAYTLAKALKGKVGLFKIGFEFVVALFTQLAFQEIGATALFEDFRLLFRTIGKSIFLDIKAGDIPNTVQKACAAATKSGGVKFINVHCLGGSAMMLAARKGVDEAWDGNGQKPWVIAVTILTSMDRKTLNELGIRPGATLEEIVGDLAVLAQECGMDGVVCSPLEIGVVRQRCGQDFVIITPGIRDRDDDKADQVRTMTAAQAIAAGADYIVVGRPITGKPDPAAAATQIAAQIEEVLAQRSVV